MIAMENTPFDSHYKDAVAERTYREGIEARDRGDVILGVYCAFTPKEILAAAGGIPVALCAGTEKPIEAAENVLPRNLCPLIKSTFGHALLGTCPYMAETEFIFADMTCDGKKKMFEFLGEIKPMHLLALPQEAERPASLRYWLEELRLVRETVERVTGRPVTDEALREQIVLYNGVRAAMEEVCAVNAGGAPLATCREIEAICEEASGFECNLALRAANMRAAAAKIRERAGDAAYVARMKQKPRILVTGCPTTNAKLLDILEDAGALVVAQENCGGLKTVDPVDETGDPLDALARRYLATPCPCMSPNPRRLALLSRLATAYAVQGVAELTWDACHAYNVEAGLIKRHVTESLGLPYLQIRTDYSENDVAQLRLRVDAFLELI